jgi:hypothetical protein
MKIKTFLNLLFVLLVLTSFSCNKESATSLQIKVLNSLGSPVSSASVTLYKSQLDLTNAVNPYDVGYTDNNGLATFSISNINELYFNVFKPQDCSSNAFSTMKTGTLTTGQLNFVTVTIYQVGNVSFNNKSADAYDISINGTLWQTLNGASVATAAVKAGTYVFHIKQATGATGTPIEKDYNVTVTSCSTQTIDIP